MRLLTHPVTLILLLAVAATIATPPPGHTTRPDDDKDPPNYQYRYDIGDADVAQGKVETRSGELASGRYYVNGEQSSQDVKYFADEWGYHPLVKYSASGDHSAATAHFALGEHVVKSLLNGTEVGEEVRLSGQKASGQLHRQPLHRRRRPIQLVQPYTPAIVQDATSTTTLDHRDSLKSQSEEFSGGKTSTTETSVDSSANRDLLRTISRGSVFREASVGFRQNFENFVTAPRPVDESGGSGSSSTVAEDQETSYSWTSSTPDQYSSSRIHSTSPSTSTSDEIRENSNDLFSTVTDDFLEVQNAGSFGRRLNPASYKLHADFGENQSKRNGAGIAFQSSREEASTSRPFSSTFGPGKTYSDLGSSSLSSFASFSTTTPRTVVSHSTLASPKTLGHYSSTTATPNFEEIHNVLSPETSPSDNRNSVDFHHENSLSDAYSSVFGEIFPSKKLQDPVENPVSENSLLVRYDDTEKSVSPTRAERITTPGLASYGKRRDHELYVTLRQSLESEIRALPAQSSSSTLSPPTVSTFNSKPIIVAELFDYKANRGFEYSTTFPCREDAPETSTLIPSVSSSTVSSLIDDRDTVLVTPKQQQQQQHHLQPLSSLTSANSHITTSSVILNPIQAGVSLVNAGETELITSDEQQQQRYTSRSPAPVSESIEGESDEEAIKNLSATSANELGNAATARAELYEKINPAFGQQQQQQQNQQQQQQQQQQPTGDAGKSIVASNVRQDAENSRDQRIEIQKSVEIYQNAPVHEIHYPAQVISQVSGINHQQQQQEQEEQIQQQLQQQNVGGHQQELSAYLQLQQDPGNAKQSALLAEERYRLDHVDREEQQQQHQSLSPQISLDEAGQAVPPSGTAYHVNPLRHGNELADYTSQRTGHEQQHQQQQQQQQQVLIPGPEDHVNIIKLIRENIPEVKYTPAKTGQINVRVYPSENSEGDDAANGQSEIRKEIHEEKERKVGNDAVDRDSKARSQLQAILAESDSVQRYFSGADWTRFRQQQQSQQHQQQEQQRHQDYQQQEQQSHQDYQQQEQQRHQEYQQQEQQRHQEHQDYQQQELQRQQDYQQHEQQRHQEHHDHQQQRHQDHLSQEQQRHQDHQNQEQQRHRENQQQLLQRVQENQQPGIQDSGKLELLRLNPEKILENPDERSHQPQEPPSPQPPQSIILPYDQYNPPVAQNPQNFGKLVEQPAPQVVPRFYQPQPVVAERIVEKTVHVPQPYPVEVPRIIEKKVPYPVEKIVERKVPYPVEKIVEKKVPVPQPYPVHIQVPVDRVVEKQVQILQPYPVHIEKIIEKKVPYPVQRLVPQPYPVHIIQPYPVEKIVEKPVHVPVTVEKIVEKKVHVPHPYPVQVPIKVPYPVEITKYVEQAVHVPYGVRYGVSYQQIMKPETRGLYGPAQGSTSLPLYGLSLVSSNQQQPNRDLGRQNSSQQVFHGYNYDKPSIAFVTGRVEQNAPQRTNGWEQFAYAKPLGVDSQQQQHHHQRLGFAKKSYSNNSPKLSPLTYSSHGYLALNRRHVGQQRQGNSVGGEKGGKDEYVGPVPGSKQHKPQQQQQQQQSEISQPSPHQKSRSRSSSDQQPQSPLQAIQQHSTAVTRAALVPTSVASSRRARQQQQQENSPHYQTGPGAFRQSKIEYGFKPPMIPSVQYDEKTATKVEN